MGGDMVNNLNLRGFGSKCTENNAKDFFPSQANEFNRVSVFKILFIFQYQESY